MCRNCTRCHIHAHYRKLSEYIKARVRLEDTDVLDTMIRPSSLIGMDEQVFKAVCAPNHIELSQPQPQPLSARRILTPSIPLRAFIYPNKLHDVPDLHSILRPGGSEPR